ncbi:MAG: hypothetical protein MGG11_15825 [Trichodesmium sp. MAG_R03]|nr:hypothetical protein [Trichodesmium sp. MAG_R03]
MLLNTNRRTPKNDITNSELEAKRLENKTKPKKQSKICLHMIWLKDEDGRLTAHWTTQN